MNRREFLHDSAIAAAVTASGLELLRPAQAAEEAKKGDVNSQLRIACIGVRGQGMSHVNGYNGKHNCVVATICDVDEGVIGPAMTTVEKVQGKAPKYEKDIRRVLDDKSIDCISIATPNHWHALAAIWGMQAGKDVYVEKPVSHNVSEGRRMVEASRKYHKICQTGTQSRSNEGIRQSIAFVQSGKLGKLQVSRGLCYKPRGSIGKVDGDQQPPKTMDYNLWCGPAPLKLPHRKTKNGTVHYDWHWFWEYGNGDLGNQGIHEMDKARWGLNKMTLPTSVISVGGRFGYIDDGQTANTQIIAFDYGTAELVFEVRGLPTDPLRGAKVGNIFHCENGVVVCPSYNAGIVFDNDGKEITKFSGGGDHFGNFIKAVRSRKREDLNADILEGHLSSALCHLGNISYRLGTPTAFSQQPFNGDKPAADTFEQMREHLKTNKVNLDETKYSLGRRLAIDPKTETFQGDKEADAFLTREYRKPFVVPESV
jgi:predicted dehydrogenase